MDHVNIRTVDIILKITRELVKYNCNPKFALEFGQQSFTRTCFRNQLLSEKPNFGFGLESLSNKSRPIKFSCRAYTKKCNCIYFYFSSFSFSRLLKLKENGNLAVLRSSQTRRDSERFLLNFLELSCSYFSPQVLMLSLNYE